ncbi:MAG: hypothetical protein V1850_00945 [Candidatus Bathyarchaeota archaeon]
MGSNPTPCTNGMNPLQCGNQKENIINFLLYLKSRGLRESTLLGYSRVLTHLSKHVNLDNPIEVKMFIADKEVKDSRKELIVNDYQSYVKMERIIVGATHLCQRLPQRLIYYYY